MSFSEQESVTVKRLEVAIRNSDMELLKDASYKLHERFHEGSRFEMLQELSQILAYVTDSDIPSDIKEILCPTIEEILDKETAPQSSVNSSDTTVQEVVQDYSQNSEVLTNEAPLNQTPMESEASYGNQSSFAQAQSEISQGDNMAPENPNVYTETYNTPEVTSYNNYQNVEPISEAPQVVQEKLFDNTNEVQNTVSEQNSNVMPQEEKSVEIYEPAYSNDVSEDTQNDNNMQDRINTYQEQFSSNSGYDMNIGGYSTEDIVNNLQESVVKPEEHIEENKPTGYSTTVYDNNNEEVERQPQYYTNEEKHLEKIAVFYYDKKSNPIASSTNQIEELSSIVDKIDTDIYDFEKLLKTLKEMNYKTQIVTTTQSIKLTEFLVQENISFGIPFVVNTTNENSDFEIIPMYGLSNIFRCQNCGAKILSYSFSNKVLSAKCSSCSDVMYPEIYTGDRNINPYYWQRALGAMAGSKTWILFNLPSDDEVIKDFIGTIYRNSAPEKIYLFPENNYYEDFFSKVNPNCEIITYQTQEKMISDLSYSENLAQALV